MNRYGDFDAEQRERLVSRVIQLQARFVQFKTGNIPRQLREAIRLDVVKLELVIGAYWNDLLRLKQWHDIPNKLHRSKVAAYTIKWLLHYNPVYSTLQPEQYERLDEAEQRAIVNVNYGFALQTLFFILDDLDPLDFKDDGPFQSLLEDFMYYMATGSYQEKMAALFFDALVMATRRPRP